MPNNSYVEIVGARVIHETTMAYKFTLNDNECWIPKSQSKIVEGKLKAWQWVVEQNKKQWTTVSATHQQDTIDEAVALLREALAILRRLS